MFKVSKVRSMIRVLGLRLGFRPWERFQVRLRNYGLIRA